jgi:hypothetical protein
MAHYAKVLNGKVIDVMVADNNYISTFIDTSPGEWIQTSYNTSGGVHYEPNSNTPSDDQSKALRKNYAGVGHIYDRAKDAFYAPQPYPSWTLNEETCFWECPVDYPDNSKMHNWNEETQKWDELEG